LLGDIAVSGALPPAKETKRRLLTLCRPFCLCA